MALAVNSAGYFISLTMRATDFLKQEMLWNDSSVTYATGQTILLSTCGWLYNVALQKARQHIIAHLRSMEG